jgi:hypothetical protein
MARFLSAEWFGEIARLGPPPAAAAAAAPAAPAAAAAPAELVLEQVVRDTPDGEVRYRVVVTRGAAYIEPPSPSSGSDPNGAAPPPDLTIACDWATAAAMAQGELSTHAALLAGRLRVRGRLDRLSGRATDLAGLDPVPDQVRQRTTY